MVSLSDIAKEVGFTVSVVSRALSPNPDAHAIVRKETREMIREAAHRMGYVPNRQASFNGKKGNATILCFLPDTADRLIADMMFGIAQAAGRENFPVNFVRGSDHGDFCEFMRRAQETGHSGVLTFPVYALHHDIQELLLEYRRQRNTLLLLNVPTNVGATGLEEGFASIPQVNIDEGHGGMLAARHLVERGCRRFFMTKLNKEPYWVRTNGFTQEIERLGYRVEGFLESEDDYRALKKSPVKTGIYSDRDVQALNDLILLARCGITPGENILLVGNDDKQQSKYSLPTLTTVHQPSREQGELAVHKLINIIFGHQEATECLTPWLVVRQSTGNHGNEFIFKA